MLQTTKLMSVVLPPISTIGLGPDDVTSLAESTREKMIETLQSISQPGPRLSNTLPLETAVVDSVEDTPLVGVDEKEDSSGPGRTKVGGSEDGKDETTEDEMDEDAVLLKRPREEI
jgi:lysophosphatidate acyltransferase